MADHSLKSATHRRLGGLLSHQLANGTRAHLVPLNHFHPRGMPLSWSYPVLAVVSNCYPSVQGRLLTRYSPVRHKQFSLYRYISNSPFDLHVLSMPPAFVLSQDQTLKFNFLKFLISDLSTFNSRLTVCFGFSKKLKLLSILVLLS